MTACPIGKFKNRLELTPHRLVSQPTSVSSLPLHDQSQIQRKASCACGGACPACQAKSADLNISQPNDPAEIEADQVADRVMRMPVRDVRPPAKVEHSSHIIHRKCDACETEEREEISESVMRKEAFASATPDPPPGEIPPSIKNVLHSAGQPLDFATRSFFEPRFGLNLSHIRIHVDSAAAQSTRSINARAFTLGNNIVFGSGEYNPRSESGRRLLAHELSHAFQSKRTEPVIARQSAQSALDPAATRRKMVDAAASWLASLARQVVVMRQMAATALATTPGSAAGPRAFHQYLNQESLERLLNNAISVFEAQKSDNPYVNFPVESPEQTRMGDAYARAMEQLGLAIEEARVNGANLAPDVRDAQERGYGRNRMRWIEANPAAPLAAGIRDTFTQTEQDISARRHQQTTTEFSNLAANLHMFNLAGEGARRLRLALLNASYRLVRDPTSGDVSAQSDAALTITVQPILDQLDGYDWAISQAVSRLMRAEARTREFVAAPIANAAVGNTLQAHFATRDPGYAALLADRLARMARELRGQGSLVVHARNPQDPSCTIGSVGGGLSMTAAHAEPNNFYFCRSVTIGDENDVSTVIHESAHATIPSLGSRAPLTAMSDTPRDRSYPGERIYSHLTTEEALDNAESYAFYVDELLGVQAQRATAPNDQITGCADPVSVEAAIARATYRIRLGAMWGEQTLSQFRGQTLPQGIIDVIRHGFPATDEARSRAILTHLSYLASSLNYYLPVTCRSASDAEARAGALIYSRSNRVTATGLSSTLARRSGDTIFVCPAWLTSGVDVQEDSLASILVLRYRSTVPVADVEGIVNLMRFIQEEAHPLLTGRTLQQHQDADAPP
ncbi:MAG: DUF4157 domain-containing protein [Nitrospira sp.]|nr:DUF4157 domain-containing protein [Nitrospira sp.]